METDVKEFLNKIVEFLFPSNLTCIFCGGELEEENKNICKNCLKNLPVVEKICLRCGSPISSKADYCLTCKNSQRSFDLARAPFIYKDMICDIIYNFKYNGKKYLAKHLAEFMFKTFKEIEKEILNVDIVVPVPLHIKKRKQRGFNQAELLAKELSKMIDSKLDCNGLVREKNTKTQTKLSYLERQENLKDAFVVKNKKDFKGKVVLLVDDVLTTGSTANHCSKVLKEAGAKAVYVLTFATTESDKT